MSCTRRAKGASITGTSGGTLAAIGESVVRGKSWQKGQVQWMQNIHFTSGTRSINRYSTRVSFIWCVFRISCIALTLAIRAENSPSRATRRESGKQILSSGSWRKAATMHAGAVQPTAPSTSKPPNCGESRKIKFYTNPATNHGTPQPGAGARIGFRRLGEPVTSQRNKQIFCAWNRLPFHWETRHRTCILRDQSTEPPYPASTDVAAPSP